MESNSSQLVNIKHMQHIKDFQTIILKRENAIYIVLILSLITLFGSFLSNYRYRLSFVIFCLFNMITFALSFYDYISDNILCICIFATYNIMGISQNVVSNDKKEIIWMPMLRFMSFIIIFTVFGFEISHVNYPIYIATSISLYDIWALKIIFFCGYVLSLYSNILLYIVTNLFILIFLAIRKISKT